jgi:hypothetical protein
MTTDTDAAALRTHLEAIIKEAEEAKEKAVAAHRTIQTAKLLLKEEETIEQTATTARQRLPSSSSAAAPTSQIIPATSSSY